MAEEILSTTTVYKHLQYTLRVVRLGNGKLRVFILAKNYKRRGGGVRPLYSIPAPVLKHFLKILRENKIPIPAP